jgi:hypothetical protein
MKAFVIIFSLVFALFADDFSSFMINDNVDGMQIISVTYKYYEYLIVKNSNVAMIQVKDQNNDANFSSYLVCGDVNGIIIVSITYKGHEYLIISNDGNSTIQYADHVKNEDVPSLTEKKDWMK